MKKQLPSISVVLPTYNSEHILDDCLKAIYSQKYPSELVEVIICDGGSQDKTIDIAKKYSTRIVHNPLRSGEAGKAVGVTHSVNDIIALIDSDNILEGNNWFKKMMKPFRDPDIVSSEPLFWTYRKKDSLINRYCALSGINDPMCLFLGNYDRYSYLTEKWTNSLVKEEDHKEFLKVILNGDSLPTMGANGYCVRRKFILKTSYKPYLFDIDIVHQLTLQGHNTIARPKIGIIHDFTKDINGFIKKTWRRARDYVMFKDKRSYPWKKMNMKGVLLFSLYTILLWPLLLQVNRGYKNKPDRAWLLHPLLSMITFITYVIWMPKIMHSF